MAGGKQLRDPIVAAVGRVDKRRRQQNDDAVSLRARLLCPCGQIFTRGEMPRLLDHMTPGHACHGCDPLSPRLISRVIAEEEHELARGLRLPLLLVFLVFLAEPLHAQVSRGGGKEPDERTD